MGRRRNSPVNKLFAWVSRQSMKVKTFLAVTSVLSALLALKLLIKDQDNFFVASEAVHFLGIIVLIYKLSTQKTCSGLSLKSQELTAIFLGVRVCSSFFIEGDIHTVLDFITLVSTWWVIYMITFKLKSTYIAELDNMPIYYVVVPCAVLAVLIHASTSHAQISRIHLGFLCLFGSRFSVASTSPDAECQAHYVFALGVARFLGSAHWMIQVYDTAGLTLLLVTTGYLWRLSVFLSEMVQTFILADVCYYYVKSLTSGQVLASLPV